MPRVVLSPQAWRRYRWKRKKKRKKKEEKEKREFKCNGIEEGRRDMEKYSFVLRTNEREGRISLVRESRLIEFCRPMLGESKRKIFNIYFLYVRVLNDDYDVLTCLDISDIYYRDIQ